MKDFSSISYIDNKKSAHTESLWFIYTVSVLSAWNAEFVTYPLDLIKTRMQIQGELKKDVTKVAYRGMLHTTLGVIKEEGPHKLWQGLNSVCLRHLIYSGSRMITYKALKEQFFGYSPNDKNFPLWKSALCGVTAGVVGQYLANPADLLKVHLQAEGRRRLMGLPPRVNGIWDAFIKVWSVGGIKGLWKGAVPSMQRAALVTLGDISAYDLSKQFILENTKLNDNHFVHFMASTCSGLAGASMGCPADVVKTRIMNQPLDDNGRGTLYKSTMDCYKKTVQSEGFGALYKGFIPLWMRLGPWSLVFWLTYEEIMRLTGSQGF